ncbi:hypothetical protein JOS77_08585 [Chromobacterium haemolyticum]|nr:hypothetical protein JOS77_08585 [Chromobacterium haemolyticum]
MRPGRFPGRLLIFAALLLRLPWQWLRRKPDPERTRRVLILHQFLLGDALMATSLLAKARERFPKAEIVLACPPGQAPLYETRPYGIRPLPWQPRDFTSIRRLFAEERFDMVYLMGENRLSFLARAIGARWIVGFAGEAPLYKNWLLDEAVPYAGEPEAWTDTAARLIDGPEPSRFVYRIGRHRQRACHRCRPVSSCCMLARVRQPASGRHPVGTGSPRLSGLAGAW